MERWEVDAREQIRDLVARYNANGDTGRIDDVVALFAEDAVLRVEDRSYTGPAEIRAMFDTAAEGTRRRPGSYIRHFTATHQIDLVDDVHAHGRLYFQVLSEIGLDHWGRYRDEYCFRDGRWMFQRRSVRVDGKVAGGWGERTESSA